MTLLSIKIAGYSHRIHNFIIEYITARYVFISGTNMYARDIIANFIVQHIIFNNMHRINFYIIPSSVTARDIFARCFNNAMRHAYLHLNNKR